MAQLQWFEELGIGAAVLLTGEEATEEYLEIDQQGVLVIPPEVRPSGFHLILVIPQVKRIVIAQKNVAQERGGYHRYFVASFGKSADEYQTWAMHDPILVMRRGKHVWTSWHQLKPNRIDCWLLEEQGHVELFQIGVITHDDGQTFRLLGEYRWRGQLFQDPERGVVGKPDDPCWGAFDVRRPILDDPDFGKLLQRTTLHSWHGTQEESEPPLASVPGPGFARMQWYSAFAGRTGQGPAILHDGSPAWVHGVDILEPPDQDGIKRLWQNDLVKYEDIQHNWGGKENGPPKLLCVRRL